MGCERMGIVSKHPVLSLLTRMQQEGREPERKNNEHERTADHDAHHRHEQASWLWPRSISCDFSVPPLPLAPGDDHAGEREQQRTSMGQVNRKNDARITRSW